MEDSRKGSSNRVIALVVRQFIPSRIEGELLAQIFDLVCLDPQNLINASAKQRVDDQSTVPRERDLSLEPQLGQGATS